MAGRTRVAKDPEQRRGEIIAAAEELFLEKGVEETMVSDIVGRVGVAQGTFYNYFKSKQEILSAILERQWESVARDFMSRPGAGRDGALAALGALLGGLLGPGPSAPAAGGEHALLTDPVVLRDYHSLADEARMKALCPVMEGIVLEGMGQGVFAPLVHPMEATQVLFYGINAYMHRYTPFFHDERIRRDKIGALAELLERVLGLGAGSLDFMTGAGKPMKMEVDP